MVWKLDKCIALIPVYVFFFRFFLCHFLLMVNDSFTILYNIECILSFSLGKQHLRFTSNAYDGWGMITQECHFIIFSNSRASSPKTLCRAAKYRVVRDCYLFVTETSQINSSVAINSNLIITLSDINRDLFIVIFVTKKNSIKFYSVVNIYISLYFYTNILIFSAYKSLFLRFIKRKF